MLLAIYKLIKGPICGSISRLSSDVLVPVLLVPLLLYFASISIYCTCFAIVFVLLMFLYVKKIHLSRNPRTQFFVMWLTSSIFWLFLLFNICVIGLLEILWEENLVLVIMGIISTAFIYNTKFRASHLSLPFRMPYVSNGGIHDNSVIPLTSNGNAAGGHKFCKHCQSHVTPYDSHSLWINCCIGRSNHLYFMCGTIFGMLALFYGANLTLTTICHPFILYKGILLPDDCTDVYYELGSAICFVCGAYSMTIASFILLFLLKKLVCGLTGASIFIESRNNDE